MPFDGAGLSQVKRDLIRARELLVENGWMPKCGNYRTEGPHCIMTALTMATDFHHRYYDAGDVLIRVSGLGDLPALIDWNDSRKSIEPILSLFDEAIAAA